MAFSLPPPPVSNDPNNPSFRDWFYKLQNYLAQALDLSNVSGILNVENGGTGTAEVPTNGELLIGNGVDYDVNTLTAGTNITITNGAGTITIDAASGSVPKNVLTEDLTVEADTSYIVAGYLTTGTFSLIVEGNVAIL